MLALNSGPFSCLSFLSSGITNVAYRALLMLLSRNIYGCKALTVKNSVLGAGGS